MVVDVPAVQKPVLKIEIDGYPVVTAARIEVRGLVVTPSTTRESAIQTEGPGGSVVTSASISFGGMVISPVLAPSPSVRVLRLEVPVLPPNSVAAIAEHLVREQHYIEESMKRLGEQGLGRSAARSETGRLLIERKEAMHDEIVDLEQEILRLSREARGETSDLLNDAATTIVDDKLKERVRYSRALIGGEDPEYTTEFEAETSRIVEELLEELESASRGPAPIRGLLFERR